MFSPGTRVASTESRHESVPLAAEAGAKPVAPHHLQYILGRIMLGPEPMQTRHAAQSCFILVIAALAGLADVPHRHVRHKPNFQAMLANAQAKVCFFTV